MSTQGGGAARFASSDAADADDTGALDISDAITILSYLFTGGRPLPPPSDKTCGSDPTADAIDCSSYGACP